MQAIFKVKYPHILTQGLVVKSSFSAYLPQFDWNDWNPLVSTRVRSNFGQSPESVFDSIEDGENKFVSAFRYDVFTEQMVPESESVQRSALNQ